MESPSQDGPVNPGLSAHQPVKHGVIEVLGRDSLTGHTPAIWTTRTRRMEAPPSGRRRPQEAGSRVWDPPETELRQTDCY
jgi:hypothetical protein